jgi:hypothetical protein
VGFLLVVMASKGFHRMRKGWLSTPFSNGAIDCAWNPIIDASEAARCYYPHSITSVGPAALEPSGVAEVAGTRCALSLLGGAAGDIRIPSSRGRA